MTEWNAAGYAKQSSMQKWLADECVAGLDLGGVERVLDIGCGDGKITAEIAGRLGGGTVLGVDPSMRMIDFARERFAPLPGNLAFEVGDARQLSFREEFDLVVSFNALHWVPEQRAALGCIRAALTPSGRAVLQFVSRGERRSLEDVIEEVRGAPRWAGYFSGYRTPFIHVAVDEYAALLADQGLRLDRSDTNLKAWDFGSREAFVHFAEVTFVEWTRMLPPESHQAFIADVLDAYCALGDGTPGDAGVFHFYQMRVALRRA
jgi:trans-aconitate methyltransferase